MGWRVGRAWGAHAEDHVRDGRQLLRVQPPVDHSSRTNANLLRGLEAEHDGAGPRVPRREQRLRGAEQRRDMHIVPARMHNRLLDAVLILHAHLTRVVEAGLLLDGEGVEVGAQQHGLAVSVAERGRDAVAADARVHDELGGGKGVFLAEELELGGDAGGGFFFEGGEFGVRVEVLVEGFVAVEGGAVLGDDVGYGRHGGGHWHFVGCGSCTGTLFCGGGGVCIVLWEARQGVL